MNFQTKRAIYEGAPRWLKKTVTFLPFSLIAGRSYRKVLHNAKRVDRLTFDEVKIFQESRLQSILEFAVDYVPYYSDLKRAVEKKRPFDALREFPLIDKETLQKRMIEFTPNNLRDIPHYSCTTGGTSGNQLSFLLDNHSQSIEMAFMHRQWARVGYNTSSRKAAFRGVEFPKVNDGEYSQLNPIYNELQFSPFHLNERTFDSYLEELVEFAPEYLHGYPSAIYLFVRLYEEKGVPEGTVAPRAVLLGSESLLPGQRERIERVLRSRVFSWYGHSERVVLAGECEVSQVYHHFPDYGVLEFVDENGEMVNHVGDRGEIVGTGLFNRSLPLIRYRTGDNARLRESFCECGRAFQRFDEVEGRWQQESVLGKNDSEISVAALNIHGPVFDRVVRYQYYQERKGEMEIRVLPNSEFTTVDLTEIKSAFERKVGDELEIEVKIVEEIPLTKRGKLQRLVRDLVKTLE